AGDPAEGFALRQACTMCEYPVPTAAPIVLQQFGGRDELWIEASDGWGERLGLRPVPAEGRSAHERAVAALIGEHTVVRDRILGEMAATTADPAGLAALFSTCIRCHNCMTNCPICYCKTCFFKTDVFDHDPMQFILWAERKGATRLPPDTVLFHLTRMNHMSTSCVGCGLCTSACPAGIPVGAAFRAVAARTQAVFGYVAGRSLEDTPPVKTFAVDELRNLGDS
ncbi:MAG TPA: 4Fe-4S dicluster domain-containing protein, partial [Anaerolineae bacterium]